MKTKLLMLTAITLLVIGLATAGGLFDEAKAWQKNSGIKSTTPATGFGILDMFKAKKAAPKVQEKSPKGQQPLPPPPLGEVEILPNYPTFQGCKYFRSDSFENLPGLGSNPNGNEACEALTFNNCVAGDFYDGTNYFEDDQCSTPVFHNGRNSLNTCSFRGNAFGTCKSTGLGITAFDYEKEHVTGLQGVICCNF